MPQVHSIQDSEEEISKEEEENLQPTTPLEEPHSRLPTIPFLLSLVAFIPLAIVVGYFLSVGRGASKDSPEMAAAAARTAALRTPVYFLSHGGVSCPPSLFCSSFFPPLLGEIGRSIFYHACKHCLKFNTRKLSSRI